MAGKKLNAIITIGGAVSGTLRGAISATKGGLDSIGKSITDLTNRQRALNREMNEWRPGANGANLRLDLMRRETAGIDRQIALLRQRQTIEQKITGLQDDRARYASNIGQAALAFGAIAGAAGVAFKASADFDYQMQLIGNTADMTAGQIGALRNVIIDTSRETGQSAQTTQKAMGFLVAAGMDAATATKMLATVGRTATASGGEIEDVARAAFTLNDALKIDPTNMQQALDVLAQAGKMGNVEFKDMAAQLPVLGSSFNALKMQGAEAAATMGAALQIARKGAGDPTEAANNLKNFMAKVQAPETLKRAQKLGLDLNKVIVDAQKQGKNPFEAAVSAIMKTTGGDQKKLGELFGDMQVQNFLRPMMQNWEEYQKIKEASLSANGVTDRDFAKVMGTSAKQIENVGSAFGRLKIEMGKALDGPGAGALQAFANVLDRMALFAREHPNVVAGAVAIGLAMTGATVLINGAAWAFASVRIAALRAQSAFIAVKLFALGNEATGAASGVARLSAAFSAFRASALGSSIASLAASLTGVLAPAFTAVGAAIMATPIGWIAAGIAAVVAGGVLIYKYWEPLKAFFVGFGQGLVAAFAPIAQAISAAFAPVVAVIGPIVRPIFEAISSTIGAIVGWFGQLLTPISAASETTKSWGEVGKAAGEAVAGAIKLVLSPLTSMISLVSSAIDKFKLLGSAWEGAKNLGSKAWNAAKNAVGAGDPPKRAYGGPVRAGRPYIVGERRPELFVPNANGRIVPNIPRQATEGERPAPTVLRLVMPEATRPAAPEATRFAPQAERAPTSPPLRLVMPEPTRQAEPIAPRTEREGEGDRRIAPYLPQAGASAAPAAAVASNDNRQFIFNITAAPGQNPKAIADEVERRLRSSGRSSALHDHAMGY